LSISVGLGCGIGNFHGVFDLFNQSFEGCAWIPWTLHG
jgi:hypothetical protein